MSERLRIIFAYVFVILIWGSTWLVIKLGLETLSPLFAAGLRFSVASLVLVGLVYFRRVSIPRHRRAITVYLIIALCSFSVPFAMVYWGEQYIPSGLASILFAVYPFSVALFSYFLLPSERLTRWTIAGIILGFAGIVAIFSNDVAIAGQYATWGMAAVLGSAVLQGFSIIALKKYGDDIHPFAVTLVPMSISALILIGAGLCLEQITLENFTATAIFSIFYLGIFGSVVTFVSYFWLLKRVEAVYLSLTAFVTPIIAVILGVVLVHEELRTTVFIGAGLVLCGIAVANAGDLRRSSLFRRN
jgi:drug/metabolite transporter (DMT)-like permease